MDTAELDQDRIPLTLTMDEIERICYVYKQICEEHGHIEKYTQKLWGFA